MDYLVIGADGQKYGPASEDVLKQWISEGRIGAQSMLEDVASGRQIPASQVQGLFAVPTPMAQPQTVPPSNYAGYNRPISTPVRPAYGTQESTAPLWQIIIRCGLALFFLMIFKYAGLILSVIAVVYAIQLKAYGSKYGTVALVLAFVTLAIVGSIWYLRFNGSMS